MAFTDHTEPKHYLLKVSQKLTKIHLKYTHPISQKIKHLFKSINYDTLESTTL